MAIECQFGKHMQADAPAPDVSPRELPRILLVSENFPPKTGGSGRWFWELYRRLPRDRVVIAAGTDPRQDAVDATHDLHVVRIPLTMRQRGIRSVEGLKGYGRAIPRLWRLARRDQVDALHCGRCLPEGLMGLALRATLRLPYVCYVHGEELNTASTSRELTWLTRRVLARAAYVIANSRNTSQILQAEWDVPVSRIKQFYPGVDTQRFVPAPRHAETRARLGWGTRPVVLTVGRLQKRKGQDMMIRALPAICRAIPDVLYAVLGDGEEQPALEALIAQEKMSEHVQLLGNLDDERLLSCYQQCDLFALPNRAVGRDIEGFGMVLLEAQACGKPVLAGASGGTAETMAVPETGVIVPCETPDPLAAQVVELLTDRDRLARMGQAARRFVVERFDWGALAWQAREVFQLGPREGSA